MEPEHFEMTMRSKAEIAKASHEFQDRVWYNRHIVILEKRLEDGKEWPPGVLERAQAAAEEVEKQYNDLFAENDFEWGMVNGKLSALRWVLGDDWDFLDT